MVEGPLRHFLYLLSRKHHRFCMRTRSSRFGHELCVSTIYFEMSFLNSCVKVRTWDITEYGKQISCTLYRPKSYPLAAEAYTHQLPIIRQLECACSKLQFILRISSRHSRTHALIMKPPRKNVYASQEVICSTVRSV